MSRTTKTFRTVYPPFVPTATTKITLKILVDKKANRVLFAEAGKDFVDFLFSLLSLPVGSVIKLLTKNNMVGCIGNLYQSVDSLDDTYIINPKTHKEVLLNPKAASVTPLNVPLLTANEDSSLKITYYKCDYCSSSYITTDPNNTCPNCNRKMSSELTFLAPKTEVAASPSGDQKGYVKGVVTYMIMDDLTVKPMSTISSITMLNKFNVGDLSLLEEKVVDFGMDEGLELLKISLQSNTALSEVFLWKKSESEVYVEEADSIGK